MKNKEVNLVTMTAAVIMVLSGCSGAPTSDFTTMCQDGSHIRIEDHKCDDGNSGGSVVFISTSSDYHAPAVGGKIQQERVLTSLPQGKTVQKAAIPSTGGIVKNSPGITRGGFGSSGGGKSSGG